MTLPRIHRFDLLVALYIFALVVSELMGAKTFPIASLWGFQLNGSVAIFLLPFIFTVNDIIIEVKGKQRAQSVALSGLVVVALLVVFTAFATALPPSTRFAPSEPAYDTVFQLSIRMSLASIAAFGVSVFLDIAVFAKLRAYMHQKSLWLRNNVSNFVALLVDSIIFVTLAFYAPEHSFADNLSFLTGIILPYWLLKCLMSALGTPLTYLGIRWLRHDKSTNETGPSG